MSDIIAEVNTDVLVCHHIFSKTTAVNTFTRFSEYYLKHK